MALFDASFRFSHRESIRYTNLYTSRQSVVFKEAEIRSSFGFTA